MSTKNNLAIFTTVSAVGFGVAGTVIAPMGIIDSSMLYLIAQLLIYSATAMGFGEVISKIVDIVTELKHGKKDK